MLDFCIAEDPLAWPQGCILCGNTIERPLVDTRRDIRLPGQAGGSGFMHTYACQRCIERAMAVLGLDKREELEVVRDELEKVTTLLGNATARVDELEDVNSLSGRLSALEEIVAVRPGQEPADIG